VRRRDLVARVTLHCDCGAPAVWQGIDDDVDPPTVQAFCQACAEAHPGWPEGGPPQAEGDDG
jgi:hypothetical protein